MMINIGLSPNLEPEDSWLAFKLLLQPWKWKNGTEIGKLEDWFSEKIETDHKIEVKAFNSGRAAEYEILKSLKIGKGDEVLLQAFTCVAVPNSILWLGAEPVYVDIDSSLTMNPSDLEKKITPKAKAVIVQHTFGNLANLKEIGQICKKHGLILIEDCAHTIKRDLEGDAAFYSFGRDKAISSVFGGLGIIRKELGGFGDLRDLGEASSFWILQQLLHPVAMAVILPLYNWANLGKLVLFALQKLKLLSFPVYKEEKEGKQPKDFPKRMPNALAILALAQLDKLDKFEKRRREIAGEYVKELGSLGVLGSFGEPLLRYPILVEKPEELRQFAKKRGVILGNWYRNTIDPKGTNFEKIGYQTGSCPTAEKMASQIINLPTYPRMKDEDVFRVIREFGEKND